MLFWVTLHEKKPVAWYLYSTYCFKISLTKIAFKRRFVKKKSKKALPYVFTL